MARNRTQVILTALLNRVQELEDASWALLTNMSVLLATGDLLDKLGKLVGEPRLGRSDADYRVAIKLQIRTLRSRGRATDIIDVSTIAAINSTPKYTEHFPAGWQVDIDNLPASAQVATKLGHAKAAGTYGVLVSTPDAGDYLIFGDDTDAAAPATREQWADDVANNPDNMWANGLACPP